MAGHVFVVASGFGLRIIPKSSPYRFRLAANHPAIDVERDLRDGGLFARVLPDGRGGYTSRIAEGTPSLYDVAEIEAGPDFGEWQLETHRYRLPLDAGWTAEASGDADDAVLFDLVRGPDASIFLQPPKVLPKAQEIGAPGQVLVVTGARDGSSWCRLEYEHAGEPWTQVHEIFVLGGLNFVVTGQAPVSQCERITSEVASLARRITRC